MRQDREDQNQPLGRAELGGAHSVGIRLAPFWKRRSGLERQDIVAGQVAAMDPEAQVEKPGEPGDLSLDHCSVRDSRSGRFVAPAHSSSDAHRSKRRRSSAETQSIASGISSPSASRQSRCRRRKRTQRSRSTKKVRSRTCAGVLARIIASTCRRGPRSADSQGRWTIAVIVIASSAGAPSEQAPPARGRSRTCSITLIRGRVLPPRSGLSAEHDPAAQLDPGEPPARAPAIIVHAPAPALARGNQPPEQGALDREPAERFVLPPVAPGWIWDESVRILAVEREQEIHDPVLLVDREGLPSLERVGVGTAVEQELAYVGSDRGERPGEIGLVDRAQREQGANVDEPIKIIDHLPVEQGEIGFQLLRMSAPLARRVSRQSAPADPVDGRKLPGDRRVVAERAMLPLRAWVETRAVRTQSPASAVLAPKAAQQPPNLGRIDRAGMAVDDQPDRKQA